MEASSKIPRPEAVDMETQPTDQSSLSSYGPGTVKDDGDMQRMGKVQEFKVSVIGDPQSHISHPRSEKFATCRGTKLCFRLASNMGVYFDVSDLSALILPIATITDL